MESFQPGLSFIPVSRAEISARPKDKILLKHSKRLHDQNSARAEISALFELPGLKLQNVIANNFTPG
jgi:hypothetical protein